MSLLCDTARGGGGQDETIIEPKSLLPFYYDQNQAEQEFQKWINKLWFAPNKLKKQYSISTTLKECTFLIGPMIRILFPDIADRGTHYYVTESYSAIEDGKSVTRTRQVRRTSWSPVSGSVSHFFDDILIPATKALPEKYIEKLEPWDLNNLVPFDKRYLSGFITEKYQTGLDEGFGKARMVADGEIRYLIKRDIGGDEQRISNVDTSYDDITFKHILLPIFVSAYTYVASCTSS